MDQIEVINISTEKFIDWYFADSDAIWILKDMRFNIANYGIYKIELLELFDTCGFLPANLRPDYNYKIHLGQQYDPNLCQLVTP